ncbi:MAG: ABC transporter substrate-binding protein [Anaerolineales bacterium]|nr:ABC transporter substrate-binding protein [Anaerolineales bacterium]
MKKQHYAVFTLVVLFALLLGACGQAPAQPTAVPAPKDKVVVQFSWFPSVEFAGFYVAATKGYYAEANLDVTLLAGGPDSSALGSVDSGAAQFGIAGGDSLILARAEGKDFTSVAAIFKENPLAITSLKKDNILAPADLAGKTVGVYSMDLSDSNDLPFRVLMNSVELDPASMKYALIQDFEGANEIKAGRMDAMSGMFATDQLVMAQQSGEDLNFIYYKDYGFDVYANTIFAKSEFLKSNADLARRFVQATMKGYQYALANTDEAAEITVSYDTSLNLDYQKELMKAQIPFISPSNTATGLMDEGVWKNTQAILLEYGLLSKPIDLNAVFTNEFIAQ